MCVCTEGKNDRRMLVTISASVYHLQKKSTLKDKMDSVFNQPAIDIFISRSVEWFERYFLCAFRYDHARGCKGPRIPFFFLSFG